MSKGWEGRPVLVTGGASFIGSHLVDELVKRRAQVRVVDDLSSGAIENIRQHLADPTIEFRANDLREPGVAREVVAGMEVVFHLAADHGGRGYVDTHQADPAVNLMLDGVLFREALKAGVERLVYASSGCVYPNYLQTDPAQVLYLNERAVGPPYDADNLYGWAKLMGELTLQAYHREHGMKTASCRYFTVYGPRAKENHAVMAMIAKAVTRQDPFEVWGTGEQIRNWTHVDDIVTGTILAAERIEDGTAINLGTTERIRVLDAANMVLSLVGHQAEIVTCPDMPTGPLNRVADNTLAKRILDWEPQVSFQEGLHRTVNWYLGARSPEQARRLLHGGALFERNVADAYEHEHDSRLRAAASTV
jgi:nucleoside-diphosphate-sugar epimerase